MSKSTIWFLLAFLWLIDGIVSTARHRPDQATLVIVFACLFFLAGVFVRLREKRRASPPP